MTKQDACRKGGLSTASRNDMKAIGALGGRPRNKTAAELIQPMRVYTEVPGNFELLKKMCQIHLGELIKGRGFNVKRGDRSMQTPILRGAGISRQATG